MITHLKTIIQWDQIERGSSLESIVIAIGIRFCFIWRWINNISNTLDTNTMWEGWCCAHWRTSLILNKHLIIPINIIRILNSLSDALRCLLFVYSTRSRHEFYFVSHAKKKQHRRSSGPFLSFYSRVQHCYLNKWYLYWSTYKLYNHNILSCWKMYMKFKLFTNVCIKLHTLHFVQVTYFVGGAIVCTVSCLSLYMRLHHLNSILMSHWTEQRDNTLFLSKAAWASVVSRDTARQDIACLWKINIHKQPLRLRWN